MDERGRILLAFVVSPLALPLLWAAWALYHGVSYGETLSGVCLYAAPAAYLAAAIFGAPIFLLYRALGWGHPATYLAGGIVMGLATGFTLWLLFGGINSALLALCSAAGASSALISWLILRRREYEKAARVSAGGAI